MAGVLEAGDIGLVRLRGVGVAGAIWTGRRWAVKVRDTLIIGPFPAIAAWRVGEGDRLSAFLAEASGAPFRFGDWDCALTVANWVEAATGRDPASSLRGRYATRLGWVRIVNRAGGMLPLFAGLARQAGLKRVA